MGQRVYSVILVTIFYVYVIYFHISSKVSLLSVSVFSHMFY